MTESEIRAEMGRAGGIARAKGMSKRARKESAIKAAKARWNNKPKKVTDLQRLRAQQGFIKGNSADRRKARRAAQ